MNLKDKTYEQLKLIARLESKFHATTKIQLIRLVQQIEEEMKYCQAPQRFTHHFQFREEMISYTFDFSEMSYIHVQIADVNFYLYFENEIRLKMNEYYIFLNAHSIQYYCTYFSMLIERILAVFADHVIAHTVLVEKDVLLKYLQDRQMRFMVLLPDLSDAVEILSDEERDELKKTHQEELDHYSDDPNY